MLEKILKKIRKKSGTLKNSDKDKFLESLVHANTLSYLYTINNPYGSLNGYNLHNNNHSLYNVFTFPANYLLIEDKKEG